jgi:hypothetical protein
MVELSSMDVTMAAQLEPVERALLPGTGSVIGPSAVPASPVVSRGGVGRRDLCRQPL